MYKSLNKLIMNKYLLVLTFLLAISISCKRNTGLPYKHRDVVSISVTNPLDIPQIDALVEINVKNLVKNIKRGPVDSFVVVYDTLYPFQLNDEDKDGKSDRLLFVCSLEPGEKRMFYFIKPGEYKDHEFEKRTQAEISVKTGGAWQDNKYAGGAFENTECLRVPPGHTDHSGYIRYEGPGWESDKVGYRFYLDWRNAIDIFGKIVDTMVLQNVGQDGFDSYHEPAPWGMDILKVGNSLGLGSLGIWHDERASRVAVTDSIICEIIQNGPVQSAIRTKYFGWQAGSIKTDLTSVLSIHAGSRITRHQVRTSRELQNICTGIVKHDLAEKIEAGSIAGKWTYFATWGTQSLADDNLGMAIFYRQDDLIRLAEDDESHVIVLRPANNELQYYFAAVWENEKKGIKNINEFKRYLESTVSMLDNPLLIEYVKGKGIK